MYLNWWEKQVCLRDTLIDELVAQVELERMIANAEVRMSEVMRQELAKVVKDRDELLQELRNEFPNYPR